MTWGIGMFLIAAMIPAVFDSEYRKGFLKGIVGAAAACTFLGIFVCLI